MFAMSTRGVFQRDWFNHQDFLWLNKKVERRRSHAIFNQRQIEGVEREFYLSNVISFLLLAYMDSANQKFPHFARMRTRQFEFFLIHFKLGAHTKVEFSFVSASVCMFIVLGSFLEQKKKKLILLSFARKFRHWIRCEASKWCEEKKTANEAKHVLA